MVTAVVCAACGTSARDDDVFCEVCGARLASAPLEPVDGAAPVPPPPGAGAPAAGEPSAGTSGDGPADESADEPGDGPGGDETETAPVARVAAPAPGPVCRACGGTVAPDGYCEQCGEPAVSRRDHWSERPAAWVGGVCDRGVRHPRNEDAMALAASGSFAALVVCDGVSTAPDSDVASAAAAAAAVEVLVAGGPDGAEPVGGSAGARTAAWSALLARAAVAGDDAIRATAGATHGPDDVPSCTFVAAVLDASLLVVAWLGDSRAYWLPDAGPAEQLSADDSWAGDLIARGVPRVAAEASPQAHAITRWLGPDATDVTTRSTATVVDEPGWVLVCSDGLWNYCSPAEDVARLVRESAAEVDGDPERTAGALVAWANAQGGRDNVTVALARVPAPASVSSDSLDTRTEPSPVDGSGAGSTASSTDRPTKG
ncbi:serine/threonine-protein phosphatase [Cellulomonas sp. DKR-3]|uniref:Serine/threonine-protein phosphatase n=1 Tax=Cellulomonas fulva TaxID=2835530 RepID=A0ABS5U0Q5_9CELL|nr:serine/threonine-protein phosphatase [Cellulomonas fulva]